MIKFSFQITSSESATWQGMSSTEVPEMTQCRQERGNYAAVSSSASSESSPKSASASIELGSAPLLGRSSMPKINDSFVRFGFFGNGFGAMPSSDSATLAKNR